MHKTLSNFITSLLVAVIAFGTTILYPFAVGSLSIIAGIILLVFLSLVLLSSKLHHQVMPNQKNSKIWLSFLLFEIWMLLSFFLGSINLTAFIRLIQFAGCIAAFYWGMNYPFKNRHFILARFLIKVILMCCLADWIATGFALHDYAFIYGNANSFSSVLLCWFIVLFLKQKSNIGDILFSILIIVLIFVASSRAALISILMYILLFRALKAIEGKQGFVSSRFVNVLFLIDVSILLTFIIIYANLLNSDIGTKLQHYSQLYFHKNFFSGRQGVWSGLFPFIKERWMFGYGLSTLPSVLLPNIHYSGHNTFLQISIQMGVIGTVLLLMIIKNILTLCSKNKKNYMRLSVISFILIMIFYECFEICLTQNMLACGLLMWFIMGLGCNFFIQTGGKNEKTIDKFYT